MHYTPILRKLNINDNTMLIVHRSVYIIVEHIKRLSHPGSCSDACRRFVGLLYVVTSLLL